MKKIHLSNVFLWLLGFFGFLIGVALFVLIVFGMEMNGWSTRGAVFLFLSFVMCAGVALFGVMVMVLTHISATLQRIDQRLKEKL